MTVFIVVGVVVVACALGVLGRQWRRRPRVFIDYVSPEWRHAQIRERRE